MVTIFNQTFNSLAEYCISSLHHAVFVVIIVVNLFIGDIWLFRCQSIVAVR